MFVFENSLSCLCLKTHYHVCVRELLIVFVFVFENSLSCLCLRTPYRVCV
ncbi:hypothetical protein LOTGIDRAFT_136164 [Lottia gigantea]|uniref:Uncharacterized protein n=1 Tax=Lottia gigantea TaxID=225164 RepID=V4CQ08_LOTGI|nr:hypothetical protein LOTGIDRAFT_136164 [Lottia gigantea]ESP04530.1 hypothetical protein LOTGIDRAFT_136164 [Lottia gigantea]